MNEDLTFILRFKNEATAQIKAVAENFRRAGTAVKQFQTSLKTVGASLDRIGKRLQVVAAQARLFGTRLREAGSIATVALTVPLAAAGAGILKAAGSFEQALNVVQIKTQATGEEFERIREVAKTLGESTVFSATEAAEGFTFLAKAGLDANTSIQAIGPSLALAAANGIGLGQAADAVTNILTSFGLETNQLNDAVDVLTLTANSANTNFTQLAQAFSFVAPVARALNQDFNETNAVLGALGNAGIQATRAGTGLRRILNSLIKPSAEAQKRLNELGISAFDSSGQVRSIVDILEDFEGATLKASDAQVLFGDRGGPAFSALLGQGTASIRALTAELGNAAGTAQEAADVQLRGLFGAFRELRSAIEGLAIDIADSGLLEFVTNIVRSLTEWVRSLDGTQASLVNLLLIIGAVVAALGPLLAALGLAAIGFGGLTNAIGGTIRALGTLASFLGKVSFAALLNPIGLTIAALAALAAAFVFFKDEVIEFNDVEFTVLDAAVATFEILSENVLAVVDTVREALAPAFEFLGGILESVFGFAVESATDFFLGALQLGLVPLNNLIKAFQLFGVAVRTAFTVAGLLANNVATVFREEFGSIVDILEPIAGAFEAVFGGIGNFIGETFGGLATRVGGFFDSVGIGLDGLAEQAGVKIGEFRAQFDQLDDGDSIGQRLARGIPDAISQGVEDAAAILSGDPLGEFANAVGERAGMAYREGFVEEGPSKGLKEAAETLAGPEGDAVVMAAKSLGERIGEALSAEFKAFTEGFKAASDEFVTASRDTSEQAGEIFKTFATESQAAIKGFITEGKLDFESLGAAILDTISDILAQRITGGIAAALFGEPGETAEGAAGAGGGQGTGGLFGLAGGALGGLFGGGGEAQAPAPGEGAAGAAASGAIVGALGEQTEALNAATEVATAETAGFFAGLGDTFSGLFSGLADSLGGLLSGAGDAIGSAVGGIGSFFGFGGAAAAAAGGIAGSSGVNGIKDFAFMSAAQGRKAKRFQTGGLTDSIPAMLSPGEAVVPLPNGRAIPVDMNGATTGGGSTTINITLPEGLTADQVQESSQQIAARVVREQQKVQNRDAIK